jgi:hypothetical protein
MGFREIGWGCIDWFDLEDSCDHGNEPLGPTKCCKFLSSCTTGHFSRRAELD